MVLRKHRQHSGWLGGLSTYIPGKPYLSRAPAGTRVLGPEISCSGSGCRAAVYQRVVRGGGQGPGVSLDPESGSVGLSAGRSLRAPRVLLEGHSVGCSRASTRAQNTGGAMG